MHSKSFIFLYINFLSHLLIYIPQIFITNFTSAYGNWYFRQHQSSPWIPLELASEITPAHYLQYQPLPNLYEFGLDYINMTEAGKCLNNSK